MPVRRPHRRGGWVCQRAGHLRVSLCWCDHGKLTPGTPPTAMTPEDILRHLSTEQMARAGLIWENRRMVNERLRRCMLRAGLGTEALAERAQVSTKTVGRW